MKRVFMVALAVLISVAFVTSVFAQAPAKPADKPAAEKPAAAPDKAPAPAPKAPAPEKKAKTAQYAGEVVSMDATAKTLVVKGKKGDMTFDVATAKMKGEAKTGDKVMVKYAKKDGKMVASSVTMAPVKKAPDKPAAKPADTAPKAAPAPANK